MIRIALAPSPPRGWVQTSAMQIASLATLIADPARARMLTALMGGVALTATELALEAGVSPSTASSHLAKLTAARLLTIEKQGRHRYFRLFDDEIATLLESMMTIAARGSGPRDPALRDARVCYDHLAGARGVWLFENLRGADALSDRLAITDEGRTMLMRFGVDLDALATQRRPLTRTCLDWSERRPHLAGSLGAAILDRLFALKWARRELTSRAVTFSEAGARAFAQAFNIRRTSIS